MEDGEVRQRFGEAVRKHRLRVGMSQEELAFSAGINTTYLSDVERGKRNISLLNIRRLASALGIKSAELFEEAGL